MTNILHSITRRDIMRTIIKKYGNTDRYKGISDYTANKIISRIFELKIENLYKTGCVKIGHGFGEIIIDCWEVKTDSIKNFSIDWRRTNQLWKDNEKARLNKTLVRDLSATKQVGFKWVNKNHLHNLCYYSFRPSRAIKRQLFRDTMKNKPIMFLQNG